ERPARRGGGRGRPRRAAPGAGPGGRGGQALVPAARRRSVAPLGRGSASSGGRGRRLRPAGSRLPDPGQGGGGAGRGAARGSGRRPPRSRVRDRRGDRGDRPGGVRGGRPRPRRDPSVPGGRRRGGGARVALRRGRREAGAVMGLLWLVPPAGPLLTLAVGRLARLRPSFRPLVGPVALSTLALIAWGLVFEGRLAASPWVELAILIPFLILFVRAVALAFQGLFRRSQGAPPPALLESVMSVLLYGVVAAAVAHRWFGGGGTRFPRPPPVGGAGGGPRLPGPP